MTTQDAGLCEVCGRRRAGLRDWFAAIPGPHPAASLLCARGSENIATDVECYRIGYERLKAELATARAKALEEAAKVVDAAAFAAVGQPVRSPIAAAIRALTSVHPPAGPQEKK